MKEGELKQYILLAIIILLVVLSYFIIKPYFIAIISSFVLAYLIKPIHNKIRKSMPESISAMICILIAFLVLILPFALLIGGVTTQSIESLNVKEVKSFLSIISAHPILENLNINLDEIKQKGTILLVSLLTSTLKQIPHVIVSILITLIGTYYILLNWEEIVSSLKNYLPFKNKDHVSKEISKVTDHIVYGTILIAFVELFIAVIGFYFLGVNFYLLFAVLIFISAFIPFIGPGLIWLPLAAYYLFTSRIQTGIGIIIIGLIISILIELMLKNKIIGDKTKINPFIILLGVFGGISLFGIFGFIIGPLILIYTIKLLQEAVKHID